MNWAATLSRKNVVSVFPSKKLQLQTTRSWDFLGFPQPTTMKNPSDVGSDVVVGVIDSGIWLELPSFDDRGFGPPPAKWKGVCKGGSNFTSDGVDVISVSIRTLEAVDIDADTIAIGDFHATRGGILTVHSAGNSGPQSATTCSVAPWLLSVAASTIDRKFESKVVLGNGNIVTGVSVNAFAENGVESPLIHGDASLGCAGACDPGCLDSSVVKNKIVICDSSDGKKVAFEAGAKGVIYPYNSPDAASVVALPASGVDFQSLDAIISYHNSTKNPVAEVLKCDIVRDPGAPLVASFSSRGPNSIISGILKPDVSAPGVDILAGFSFSGSINN
ncbi:unnamed protein product [Linum tenue]|uniref:Peptidase S8/S53 domain-containing protein n=1 Tax=Linum tenue TaxID=586396 RepID=A0AAV0Q7M1_9ROSI|nr:unnamed protein product [Linum tenue]